MSWWEMDWWSVTKDIIGAFNDLASVVLLIGLFSGIAQLKLMKKDLNDRNIRAARETSMQYLTIFASDIIPAFDKYFNEIKEELITVDGGKHLFNKNFTVNEESISKELLAEQVIKHKYSVNNVLNKLEFFSAAMLNELADERLVFVPVGKTFCEMVEMEHLTIALFRNNGVGYNNLITLYNKWSDRIEVEQLELQKNEAEAKIKAKGDHYKDSPPIGFN